MKFVSASGREFDTYTDAQQDENEYYNKLSVSADDIIKNIIFYNEQGNVIPIDTDDIEDSFEKAYDTSNFIEIEVGIDKNIISYINHHYVLPLPFPLNPGMYRYDEDSNEWVSLSADKNAFWKKWEGLVDKGRI